MRRLALLFALSSLAAIGSSTASAEQFCNHRFAHGEEITVTRYGSTSCQLARSGAEHVIDLGYAPAAVVAFSSVTDLHYVLYRVAHSEDSTFFTATYRGRGKGDTHIGFRLTIVKD
jgi:hypothetical protein